MVVVTSAVLMATSRDVLSEPAELASGLIMMTAAEYEARRLMSHTQRSDPLPELACVAQCVTVAESYVIEHDAGLAEARRVQMNDRVYSYLFESTDRVSKTWHAALQRLGVTCNVDLLSEPVIKSAWALVEARNSWAHGMGVLTHRQAGSREQIRAGLEPLGIKLAANRIVVPPVAVPLAARTIRDMIVRLDGLDIDLP